ncbi:hypothetical protein FRB99_008595 [Tulasnella sp. 403]|nr:hypothetical protein FRB99_008595 [Tulasnella sp. 403]
MYSEDLDHTQNYHYSLDAQSPFHTNTESQGHSPLFAYDSLAQYQPSPAAMYDDHDPILSQQAYSTSPEPLSAQLTGSPSLTFAPPQPFSSQANYQPPFYSTYPLQFDFSSNLAQHQQPTGYPGYMTQHQPLPPQPMGPSIHYPLPPVPPFPHPIIASDDQVPKSGKMTRAQRIKRTLEEKLFDGRSTSWCKILQKIVAGNKLTRVEIAQAIIRQIPEEPKDGLETYLSRRISHLLSVNKAVFRRPDANNKKWSTT